MSCIVPSEHSSPGDGPVSRTTSSPSLFAPFAHGWRPSKLPELATHGFPFAPPFLVRSTLPAALAIEPAEDLLPFGFFFRVRKERATQPVIDLTRGFYDPQTQLYTVPLRAGGDTEGDEFETGYWTDHGDGKNPNRNWDIMTDRESD